ncbi:MAG: hypothetical protein ACOCX1_01270 [Fimbriimonadaceae bacterium]
MELCQVLIHGHGFRVQMNSEDIPITGFYTTRRVKANGPQHARLVAIELVQKEPETKSLVQESISKGAKPSFDTEKVARISFWQRLFGKYPKGFVFYAEEEEGSS